MNDRLFPLLGATTIIAAAVLGWQTPALADGDCSKLKLSQVKAACDAGGQKAVKKLMREAVKKAKADGKKWKCTECHTSTKTYDLKPGAADKLKPYL